MLVDLKDGRCRTCGSQLEIIDVDDISLHVECIECADFYQVESDAFGDGCVPRSNTNGKGLPRSGSCNTSAGVK